MTSGEGDAGIFGASRKEQPEENLTRLEKMVRTFDEDWSIVKEVCKPNSTV
jgi:hypothetical protein